MAQYIEVNGQNIEFPDGMAVADIEAALKKNSMSLPVAVSAGKTLNAGISDIPRQVGLTARYALEGPAQALQIFSEPVRTMVTDPLLRAAGAIPDGRPNLTGLVTGQAPQRGSSKPLGEIASGLADWLGLPKPQGANERVIGDAARLVAGAGGMNAAARTGAALPGVVGDVLTGLSSGPTQQLTSAAGAGLLGGASREAGGGPITQAAASTVGAVLGGFAPGAAQSALDGVRRLRAPAMTPAQMDIELTSVLGKAGQDYSQIPETARAALRAELGKALQAGKELDPRAVARLADFKAVGATPTRGMVTLDPVQITREQNLAKMAANSGDTTLQGLPLVQNQNNQTLIRNLNDAGATRGDPFQAGQRVIGAIASKDAEEAAKVTGLYNAARDMPGGSIPLERTGVVNGIYDALAKENKMAFLPENVSNMLNTISKGSVRLNGQDYPVPFDAKALDNLMTTISTAQRGTTDGNVKAALLIARKAIDSAAVSPIKAPVAGNPAVTGAGAAYLRNADAEAPAFMDALNQARSAARSRFGWQESSRPVEAALAGAQPDAFVKRYVIGGSLADAEAVMQNAPAAGVKDAIVAHLKEKALNGSADEVGKFSQSAYNKALSQIGERKLAVFFSPQELAQLRTLGRVASYMQTQPAGSAVNNSNSGALILGRGMDMLGGVARKLPFGKEAVADPLRNMPIGQSLVIPGLAAGGLLSAPP
jgi:hypothetical protein